MNGNTICPAVIIFNRLKHREIVLYLLQLHLNTQERDMLTFLDLSPFIDRKSSIKRQFETVDRKSGSIEVSLYHFLVVTGYVPRYKVGLTFIVSKIRTQKGNGSGLTVKTLCEN